MRSGRDGIVRLFRSLFPRDSVMSVLCTEMTYPAGKNYFRVFAGKKGMEDITPLVASLMSINIFNDGVCVSPYVSLGLNGEISVMRSESEQAAVLVGTISLIVYGVEANRAGGFVANYLGRAKVGKTSRDKKENKNAGGHRYDHIFDTGEKGFEAVFFEQCPDSSLV